MSKPGQTHSVRNRQDMPAGIARQRLRHPRTTRPTTTSRPSCSRSRPRCRAKAAGNESVDGRMTTCDDEIGRLTTTQQPTNERRVRTTTEATATARWAAARRDAIATATAMAMATGDDDDDDDDDGATTTTVAPPKLLG